MSEAPRPPSPVGHLAPEACIPSVLHIINNRIYWEQCVPRATWPRVVRARAGASADAEWSV